MGKYQCITVGRITSGSKSETWERVHGAAGSWCSPDYRVQSKNGNGVDEKFTQTDSVAIERRSRIDYDDFAGQQDGEMTFIVGKKGKCWADNKEAIAASEASCRSNAKRNAVKWFYSNH